MPIEPQPCGTGGDGTPPVDVEQNILCDTLEDGTVVGTALAVYEYDSEGNPTGPPTFVDPATGLPYVAQGTLMPCPGETGCLEPVQFCFTSAVAGPVDHPGRIYDFDLAVNPGFDFTSLIIDGTENAAGITWQVTDADGATFAADVQQFIQNRFTPLGGTVTVTNPNAGAPVCGTAQPLHVHIECVRIDQPAPDVVEAVYNAGTDLVQNPAYLTTPPTNLDGPQFVYLQRQDAGGTLNCTSVANRGWETNDVGPNNQADFELWGTGPGGLQQIQAATPTPRGTPIQEITADISGGANPQATIWQTFNVPAAGNFIAKLVHGARDTGETHTIRLSTGDTDDTGPGDIINDVTNPVQVTNAGGGSPGPWTQFQQNVALGAGLYTFSLSTTNPQGANRGGLFTDMRVYVDAPGTRVTADTDDDTCVVTVDETSTTTRCEWWSPLCELGDITGWKNAETGEILDNGSFWGQTPSPECCMPEAGEGGGGTVSPGNLVHTYLVCGIVGGVPQTLSRVVYTDQAGGVVAGSFIGEDGGPVAPTEWAPGPCSSGFEDAVICYTTAGDPTRRQGFRREAVSPTTGQVVVSFIGDNGVQVVPNFWRPGECTGDTEVIQLCDSVSTGPDLGQTTSTPFLRHYSTVDGVTTFTDTALDGTTPYVPAGFVFDCHFADVETHVVCDFGTLDGDGNPHEYIQEWIYNKATGQPFVLNSRNFDGTAHAAVGPIGSCPTEAGTRRDVEQVVLCDDNGPFVRVYQYGDDTGTPTGVPSDYTLAGAPYVPVGTVGTCPDTCSSCQTLTLCDFGADEPVLITGISTGGTLSNGVTWSGARGSSTLFNPQHNNADGSWWGMPSFPNATVAPDTWFFNRPVDVEFSVVIAHSPATGSGAINQVQVPIGSELISAAPDYSYDVATGIVTVDASNTGDCTKVTNPTVANSARFVLRNVTQFTLDFLGQRIAICGQFSNWRFGSIAVTPATSTFLRTICRDCDGVVTSVTDTQTDGTTPYTPIGPVGECGAADAEPQCYATQICVQPQGVQEFISNEANLTSTVAVPNVDPVWQWSNDPVAGPWFNMYDVGVFPGWITVDPGTTEGVANWVAPHPNSSPNTSGLAGEGPTIGPGNAEWYARAQFTLPDDADPASIRIAATVINADQLGVEFRLNDGAWQPVGASHVDPPFNFPAQVIPGAQAGLNEVFVHVRETVFGSGAAGVKMHLIASYNLGDQQSWTQIVCDDGTVSYFTNAGEQADALPEDWVIVPCGGSGDSEACGTASSIGTVCYTPPVGVQTIQDDWTGTTSVVGGGSRVWTNSNFGGQGITVTETVTPDTGAALLGTGVRNTATSPATQHTVIDLGAPRTNVTVRVDFFGTGQGERLRNIAPAFAGVSGNGTAVLANTGVDGGPAGDGSIFLTFPGPVQTISWDYAPTGSGLSAQSSISFNTGNAANSAPAAVLRDCASGETTYVDLATGIELDVATISFVDCPGGEAGTAVDQQDVETLILCDATPTRFLRAIKYDAETGAVLSVVNTALDGTTPFVPVGAVGICSTPVATDFDFLSTVLCDANGTQFIQRLTFNSATGAVTSTTNTTLTGAAFAPVAPVALCSNCCPVVMGNGCTNTGSGFYTAIRATNGTISLIDSVTGATVLAANIIPCPSDNTTRTLTAQGRVLTNATPWTPGGDVAGTLTSLTVTGVGGLWDLVDSNGTILTGLPAGLTLTWSAEDDNQLTGPQSVTPQAGASVVANWTQR